MAQNKVGNSKPRSLLEDEGDEDNGGKTEKVLLTVNEAYAKRFVHNKQREDLHRFEELKKRGLIDSETDTEDDEDEDDDGALPEEVDLKIFETLTKIKKKDPQIYDPNTVFFVEPQDDEEEEEMSKAGKAEQAENEKKKPAFLKDVIASQLLEGEGKDPKPKAKARVPATYAEEQQELKNAFLRSVAVADDEDDDLLRVRKKSKDEVAKEKLEDEAAVLEYEQRQKDADINRRLEDYFGKNDDLDENDKFLKGFLLNKGWIDRDQNRIPTYHEVVGDVSEEEEELEKQEKYEHEYNFRFEEGSASHVLGHSRRIEASVRKKGDSRQKKRRQKIERLNEAARAREEELKRLKNLKKKEIMEKLAKIRSVAGVGQDAFGADSLGEDLEKDFDPDDYDRKMKDIFGAEYYNDQDADADFMADEEEYLEKPDFDAEDKALGLEEGWDGRKKAGFAAIYEQKKQILNADHAQVANGELEQEEVELSTFSQEEEADAGKKRKKLKHKISLQEKLSFDKQLEDYYKLDYEDMIGDLPTRFKYHQVKPNTYGLSAEEILTADDKELNQFVSIKKLAPYRNDEWEPPKRYHMNKKARKLQSLNQTPIYRHDNQSSFKRKESSNLQTDDNRAAEKGNDQEEKEDEAPAKGRRRKKGKNGLLPAMSFSRLLSYGKVNYPRTPNRKTLNHM